MATEYMFGTIKSGASEGRYLKTKGDVAQYLPAGSYQQAEMRYGDITESYRFKVLDCYHRKIGRDGKHYAWYHITDVTMTQRDDAPMKRAAQLAANLDYLSMMVDVALPNEGV